MASKVDHLVQQAQNGDPGAVEALYRQFADPIFRYIYYRVSSQRDAEDLTTEVFIKMVEGLPNYRITGAPFEAWLYRIASSRVIDFHRRQSRRPESVLDDSVVDTNTHLEELVQRRQELEILRNILTQLSDDEQTLLILRFVDHRSHGDVAVIMGKTPAAVKAMQHRALQRLASMFGSEEKVRHYFREGSHERTAL